MCYVFCSGGCPSRFAYWISEENSRWDSGRYKTSIAANTVGGRLVKIEFNRFRKIL